MVKARPVTGPPQARERLERLLQPFVYRRYVDYSAIDSLRSMKQLIVAEVRRRELRRQRQARQPAAFARWSSSPSASS
jgi:glutamate-ammonia-ligase adenylyltransferase